MTKDQKLSKENILGLISQEDIFSRYMRIPKVDKRKRYHSPWRNDNNPGCSFYTAPHGVLYLNDWASKELVDCFSLVMKLHFCNFFEALKIIDQDFGLGLYKNSSNPERIKLLKQRIIKFNAEKELNLQQSSEIIFSCSVVDFTEESLAYWKQFNITQDILELFNVYEVTDVRKNGKPYMRSSKNNPIFGYFFDDKVKFYRPLAQKEFKWRGNVHKNTINGFNQLPEKSATLIITKSLKDVMSLYSLGFYAIAPQGEGSFISKSMLDELKKSFNNIVIVYDNDKTGIKQSKAFSEEFSIPYILLPEKDVSDNIKIHGVDQTKNELWNLMSETFS